MLEAKRIEQTNQERWGLAQQWGWRFRADAPEVQLVGLLPFQVFAQPPR